MTDKEILAELKRSYEYLKDIRENGCIDHSSGQMKTSIKKIDNTLSDIQDIYYDFYNTLDKEDLRVQQLERKTGDKVYISPSIDGDYEVQKTHMTCFDLDYFWYEDEDFITE